MKKTLLLILFSVCHLAKASDTLTIRQAFNFEVGDTFDYKITLTCYLSAGIGYVPLNYCYQRYIITSKTYSVNNDTVKYQFTKQSIGPCIVNTITPLVITPLDNIYYNLDSNIPNYMVGPGTRDSIYNFHLDTLQGHIINSFSTIDTSYSCSYYSLRNFKLMDHRGCINMTDTSGYCDPDQPEKPFYNYNTTDLIYFSNGQERFGIPYDVASSIRDYNDTHTIHIYPIPSTGKLHLLFPEASQYNTYLILTNILDQEVYSSPISETETTHDISKLPSGIYTWRLVSDNAILKTGKIVKQ